MRATTTRSRTITDEIVTQIIAELDQPTPGWRAKAPCLGLNVGLFYPARGEQLPAMCGTCPYAVQCVTDALEEHDTHGIWGGFSERPRRALTKLIRAARPDLLKPIRAAVAECRTDAGYYRHRDNDEDPCDPCKWAHAEAARKRNAADVHRIAQRTAVA